LASTGFRARPDRFLPPDPRVEEPYRLTPKLALRIAILGGVALVLFGILFFRLWALQVLSGTRYLEEAQKNQLRFVRTPAPRGQIVDRHGRVLVTNAAGTAVQLWPSDLPKRGHARLNELKLLSVIVHVPVRELQSKIRQSAADPLDPITIKEGVHNDQVDYIYEHQDELRGVRIAQTYLRYYNSQALAAQLLGYVGEISAPQLKQLKSKGYHLGDKIGQAGVEAAYDADLRGETGLAEQRVDSLGRPRSSVLNRTLAQPGDTVRLTLDIGLQRASERALKYGIQLARSQGHWAANGGAIVAMDPRDGSILAMASNPTFKPSVYVGHVRLANLKPLLDPKAAKAANYPALNRALAGLYPAGSTWKPVTALAAMKEGLISPTEDLPCTAKYAVHGQVFKNWDPYVDQAMTLPVALAASCDTYFYQVGYKFYGLPPFRGHPLQAWASRFGFGQPTGIDIGPEASGLLPTPEWRRAVYTRQTDPKGWQIDSLWKPGDSIQLAIGQKDLLVTPLQMTRFYAMIANGGMLVTPHVVEDVEQPGSGPGELPRVVRRIVPPPPQSTGIDRATLAPIQNGLYQATHATYGTSSGVFGSFPVPIAGKTGTAEKVVNLPGFHGLMDQSWWCGYGPSDVPDPAIVVCALIENGGHGGTAAAPAALKVFEQYFHTNASPQGPVHSD
jgi:penicillin-binding protein 2